MSCAGLNKFIFAALSILVWPVAGFAAASEEKLFDFCEQKLHYDCPRFDSDEPIKGFFSKRDLLFIEKQLSKIISVSLHYSFKNLKETFLSTEQAIIADPKAFSQAVLEVCTLALKDRVIKFPEIFEVFKEAILESFKTQSFPIGLINSLRELSSKSDACAQFVQSNAILYSSFKLLEAIDDFLSIAMASSFCMEEIGSVGSRRAAKRVYAFFNAIAKLSPDVFLQPYVDKLSDGIVNGVTKTVKFGWESYKNYQEKYAQEHGQSDRPWYEEAEKGYQDQMKAEKAREEAAKELASKEAEEVAKEAQEVDPAEKEVQEFNKKFQEARTKLIFLMPKLKEIVDIGLKNRLSTQERSLCIKLAMEIASIADVLSMHDQMVVVGQALESCADQARLLAEILKKPSANSRLIPRELFIICKAMFIRLALFDYNAKNRLKDSMHERTFVRGIIPILATYLIGQLICKDGISLFGSSSAPREGEPQPDPSWLDGIKAWYATDPSIFSFDAFSGGPALGVNPITALIACFAKKIGARKIKGVQIDPILAKAMACFITVNLIRLCLLNTFRSWAEDEISFKEVPAHLGFFIYKLFGVPTVVKAKIKSRRFGRLYPDVQSINDRWSKWFDGKREFLASKADFKYLPFGSALGLAIFGLPDFIGSCAIGAAGFVSGPMIPTAILDVGVPLAWNRLCGNKVDLSLASLLETFFFGKGLRSSGTRSKRYAKTHFARVPRCSKLRQF